MRIACFEDPKSARSHRIASSMAAGAKVLGHQAEIVPWSVDNVPADIAIGYGWAFPEVLTRYQHFVHVDLGWWGRKPGHDPTGGYHKVAVNGREPSPYFRQSLPRDRFSKFMLSIRPWRATGTHVLLAGTSAKSAATRGMAAMEWELKALDRIRKVTHRPVIYRPKPSWPGAYPLKGCAYSPGHESLESVLADCWGIVTLHSNVAVDGLVAGIPAFGGEGIALAVSSGAIEDIETPSFPQERTEMLGDLAWCQWTPEEMASGACLKHLLAATPLKEAR